MRRISLNVMLLLIAIFFLMDTSKVKAESFDVTNESISSYITGNETSIVMVPGPDNVSDKKVYSGDLTGMQSALFDLYNTSEKRDYALYIGSNINLTTLTSKTIPSSVTEDNITFYSLEGKVSTLVLTSESIDAITNNVGALSGAKTVTLGVNSFFGSNMIFRNISYTGTNLYMNGHDLNLNGNSNGNGFNIYGGTDDSDLVASPTITVNATGTGNWNFAGGNNLGGTLTGNTSIKINNASSTGVITIMGGGNAGNVNGNVSTEINVADSKTNLNLGRYVGGSVSGNVSGKVTNVLKGYGRWNSGVNGTNGEYFVGGSVTGNIGSDKLVDTIETNFDTSNFNNGSCYFMGANYTSGVVIGNIVNNIRAGSLGAGSIQQVSGGSGPNVINLTYDDLGTTNNITANNNNTFPYDELSKTERAGNAEKNAKFKLYGNISTKVFGGCASYGANNVSFMRGAGWGGYVEGNVTLSVGTLNEDGSTGGSGFVYGGYISNSLLNQALTTGLPYNHETNRTESASGGGRFDIVGGGGSNSVWAPDIFVQGNTDVQLNNVLARWTYGGGFSGVYQGDTSITLNGGIVSTLEGAGYCGLRQYGNPKATVNNGQVDWFLSGGGWYDNRIYGNPAVTVYEGTINASMGGTYGYNNSHRIYGNTDMSIYGGDFSGTPLKGSNGFSGGVTNQGYIYGSTNLTLDLRTQYAKGFKFPGGTSISAGKPYNANRNSNLLGSSSDSMNLNIFSNEENGDILQGAVIYGDGGSAENTTNENININIDAPGSTIGTLYATQYSNISGNSLLRNVNVNIQRATSIGGISGGSLSDNLTNIVADNSAKNEKFSKFNIGVPADSTSEENVFQADPIKISGLGLVNFTNLIVDNNTTLTASTGSIKNGLNANGTNHSTTYSNFGNIELRKNSGIGVETSAAYISGNTLIIDKENTIESAQGTGIINISDIKFNDPDNSRLTWVKNNTTTTNLTSLKGTWFGEQQGYQVLTMNPNPENASKITPFNFKGIEKGTGKTLIGDNDSSGKTDGYGFMIPGTVIDYSVDKPVVDGKGTIEHNIKEVLPNNSPQPLKVWGTEVAGKQVTKGRLIVPKSSNIVPKLTFTPDSLTGSWLYKSTISTTKVDGEDQIIPEHANSNPVDWSTPDMDYSYDVKVKYSNQAELSAENVIFTEDEAAALTDEKELNEYTKVSGRPFLTSNITSKLDEIKQPLADGQYNRITSIKYNAGTAQTNPNNNIDKNVNIIVVKNGAVISENRQSAIFANDVTIKVLDIKKVGTQSDFEKNYTHAFGIDSDGNISPVDEATNYFDTLTSLTPEEVPTKVTASYTYTVNGSTLNKTATIFVMPSEANLIVQFLNDADQTLHDPVSIKGDIGSTVNLATNSEVVAIVKQLTSKGYQVVRPENEVAVPILENGSQVVYKFLGTLSITSAPTDIDFGTVEYNAKMKRIDKPDYVKPLTINDLRSDRSSGWTMTATLTTPMTNEAKDVLPNVLRYVYKGKEEILGADAQVVYVSSAGTIGSLNVSDSWGTTEGTDGIKLQLDSATTTYTGNYTGTITWKVMAGQP